MHRSPAPDDIAGRACGLAVADLNEKLTVDSHRQGLANGAIGQKWVRMGAGGACIRCVAPAARSRTVLVLRIAVMGLIAGVTGINVAAVRGWIVVAGSGLRAHHVAAAPGSRAVVPALVPVFGFRQAVVGLLDAQSLPRLSVGREGEARVGAASRG